MVAQQANAAARFPFVCAEFPPAPLSSTADQQPWEATAKACSRQEDCTAHRKAGAGVGRKNPQLLQV